jgi:hypothetical protein
MENEAAPVVEAPVEPVVTEPAEPVAPRTFTQAELDEQIGKRLAREQRAYDRKLAEEREQRIRLEERLNAAAPPKAEVKDGKPQLKDFDDFEKYSEALADYKTNQLKEELLKDQDQRRTKAQQEADGRKLAEGWGKKVLAALKDLPDYQDVVSNAQIPLRGDIKDFIMESDQGPQLAYYLAQHLDEAQQLAELTPAGAARKLTLIEAGFKTNPVSRTPAPLAITGSRSTASAKTLSDVKDIDEFWARRRKFIAKR